MKKKLLVLLIAVIPMLIPNLASAIEIEWGRELLEQGYWSDSSRELISRTPNYDNPLFAPITNPFLPPDWWMMDVP